MKEPRQICILAPEKAALVADEPLPQPGAGQASGRALVSLVSPGTELNCHYLAKEGFPRRPGYAVIVEVEEIGSENPGVALGDRYFCLERHCSHVLFEPAKSFKIPPGLAPEMAVFCRLMVVPMSTMTTTTARPPGRVLVVGLGPVGHLAAQIFASIGYQVEGFDVMPDRRAQLQAKGVPAIDKVGDGEIYDLALECSGHESGALAAAKAVRKGGEVVLIGTPWKKNTDLSAHELLSVIFHRYIRVRTGWEWEIPQARQEFGRGSLEENYHAALRWLDAKRIKVDGLYDIARPEECQEVYSSLHQRTRASMVTVFDWRKVG
jgi:threonine dehydrogenase-like Zn-dependent dehydrogenase